MVPSICIEMLYPGLAAEEKIRKVSSAGFRHVEFWKWQNKDIGAIRSVMDSLGTTLTNMSGHGVGSPIDGKERGLFIHEIQSTIPVAKSLGCRTLMVLSNELGAGGRAVRDYAELPEAEKRRDLLEALQAAADNVPNSMQLVVEPLNTLIDHPGYFLTGMEQAVSIVRELANPQVKILADFYHLGVMGEDLSDIARQYAKDIGYVHVADLPGRHEPGTGTVDWKSILRLLGDSGYEGIVGFEYTPHAETDASLRRVAGLWDEIDG